MDYEKFFEFIEFLVDLQFSVSKKVLRKKAVQESCSLFYKSPAHICFYNLLDLHENCSLLPTARIANC